MPVAVCPTAETLAAFARGELAANELASVAEHVGGCEACCRSLKLLPEDSLAGLARAAAAAPATIHSKGSNAPQAEGAPKKSDVPAAAQVPAGFADHPRWRIISQLGAGGMGTVYKAEDLAMGRIVAIKVVSPHLTAKASALARFRREIRLAAQLNDPRAVIAHDTGEVGGCQFLVMEFVEGVSLDRLVAKKGPLPVTLACTLTRQAALGLQHAADKGLIHRDVKPHNLMVTKKGQVKILDFGLARFARSDDEAETPPARMPFGAGKALADAGVTNPNLLMGTPDYLSPEQAKNSHEVDSRSDIYSLGCTLFFLLTGKPPFTGASTLVDKLLAHTNEEPPAIRELRPEVPEGLAEVLAKMMAKSPEDRYQKASEAAAALLPFTRTTANEPVFEIVDAVVVNPPPQAVPTPVNTPAPAARLTSDTAPPRAEPTLAEVAKPKKKKPKKRASFWQRRKWAIIGGVAALLLLAGVALAVNGRRHAANDDPNTAKANPSSKTGPQGKANDPPDNKGTKSETPAKPDKVSPWVPPIVVAPKSDEILILYVIPSNGVFTPDYEDVAEALTVKRPEKKRVRVVTAAMSGSRSSAADKGGRGAPIDVNLSVNTDLTVYSAAIFCGYNVSEYLEGPGRRAATHVIKAMQDSGKPVASICAGQAVLANHGVLKNRRAAIPPAVFDDRKFEKEFSDNSIKWQKWPVVAEKDGGKIVITAAGPPQASEFAEMILKAIEK
jgi:serine/threonine-protein kinase